jgi:hypothetical protein
MLKTISLVFIAAPRFGTSGERTTPSSFRICGLLSWARNLDGYNLKKADLYRASLWKSSLNGADLTEADLSSVTLNGALLRSATLIRTNMRFARLVGADLTDATLCGCFPWLRPFVQPLLGAAFRWWLFRLTTFLLSLRSIEAQVE